MVYREVLQRNEDKMKKIIFFIVIYFMTQFSYAVDQVGFDKYKREFCKQSWLLDDAPLVILDSDDRYKKKIFSFDSVCEAAKSFDDIKAANLSNKNNCLLACVSASERQAAKKASTTAFAKSACDEFCKSEFKQTQQLAVAFNSGLSQCKPVGGQADGAGSTGGGGGARR